MTAMTTTRGSILVLADEDGPGESLGRALALVDFDVATAPDEAAAIARLRRRKFDAALVDVDRFDARAIPTMRAIEPSLQVVVIASDSAGEAALEGLRLGAHDRLRAPARVAEVELALERALDVRHLRATLEIHEASRSLLFASRDAEARIPELGCRLLRADATCLVLRDETATEAEVRSSGTVAISERLLADMLAAAPRAHALGFVAPDARVPHLEEDDLGSAIVAPVTARDFSLGHLVLVRASTSSPFSRDEVERAAVLATQVGIALQGCRDALALEHRMDELLRTREDLVLAEKLRIAGDLATGLALELREPLATMRRASRVLHEGTAAGLQLPAGNADEVSRAIEELDGGLRRIGQLVAGFERLAEAPAPANRRPLAVAAIVADCVAALDPEAEAVFTLDVGEELHAMCSREDLWAALTHVLEFLRCARASMRPEAPRELRIRAYARERGVHVVISDPAVRLGADDRRQVLEPRLLRGDGVCGPPRIDIKLALSQQLLRRNGGDLIVHDALDGTRFSLVLERGTRLELFSR